MSGLAAGKCRISDVHIGPLRVSRAKEILKAAGGDDIASSGEKSLSSHTVGKDHADVERSDSDRLPSSELRSGNVDSGRVTVVDERGTAKSAH